MQNKIQNLLERRAAQKEAKQRAVQKEMERRSLLFNMKISPISQAAFDIKEGQEKELFSTWSVSTGTYLSGYAKGEPRVPDRLKPNSLCLLTQRGSAAPEEDRRIIGAFMVEEDFFGTYCQNALIHAHPVYRIVLNPERQLPFWPYITEDITKRRWGKTAMKYFSNTTAKRILLDILEFAGTPEEQESARQFYQYFCKINCLPARQSPKDEDASSCS